LVVRAEATTIPAWVASMATVYRQCFRGRQGVMFVTARGGSVNRTVRNGTRARRCTTCSDPATPLPRRGQAGIPQIRPWGGSVNPVWCTAGQLTVDPEPDRSPLPEWIRPTRWMATVCQLQLQ
jgi:hypothetical protein